MILNVVFLTVAPHLVSAAVHPQADGAGGLGGGAAGYRTEPRGARAPQSHWNSFG